jgi:hypothetical protein
MTRPSRLEILEYALEGAVTLRGISDPSDEEYMDELEDHRDWLAAEIKRVKDKP